MNQHPDMNENPDTDRDGHEPAHPGMDRLRAPRAPRRDLWPEIEARLTPRALPVRQSRWQRPMWLAAAGFAGIAVMTAAVLTQRPQRAVATDVAGLRAPPAVVAATLPTTSASLQPAAIVRPVHPETRALVKANLKLVNNAEVQVRKAMQSDPDAAYLQSLLATAHQQKKSLQVALSDDGD